MFFYLLGLFDNDFFLFVGSVEFYVFCGIFVSIEGLCCCVVFFFSSFLFFFEIEVLFIVFCFFGICVMFLIYCLVVWFVFCLLEIGCYFCDLLLYSDLLKLRKSE